MIIKKNQTKEFVRQCGYTVESGDLVLEDGNAFTTQHIITTLCSSLSGTLRSIDDDENNEILFYKFVQLSAIDRSAFSYNWPYIIQATRKNGFYYQNNHGIVYFYFRRKAIKSDFRNCKLVVVNHLGYESETLVCEIAEAARKLGITTVVKNVDQDKVLLWNSLGFIETTEPWSKYSFRDDNTFPEFVYDIKKFINLEMSPHTRSIIKKVSRETNYTFVPYNSSFKSDGLKLLEKNSEYLENKGVDFKNEVILAHEFVFNDEIKCKAVFAVLESNKLVGVTCLTRFKENLFFNAIINENKPNLMRFFLWKSVACFCEALEEDQWPLYLALQGSENEGQNNWKRFFHPIRSIRRTHVTNDL